jgi:hypothetical protein
MENQAKVVPNYSLPIATALEIFGKVLTAIKYVINILDKKQEYSF